MKPRHKPIIHKRGTIDVHMVETTPLLFHGEPYRFEYVRVEYPGNDIGAHFRLTHMRTGAHTAPFALGCHLGSAFVDGDTVYAFGVRSAWSQSAIDGYRSRDLVNWERFEALSLPGWTLFNTSVCKGADGYVMALEIGGPEAECGVPFTIRFALSPDLVHWHMTPHSSPRDRYTACPALRYLPERGEYYMIYLEALPGWAYVPYIARSRDLARWELSRVNPFLMFDDEQDKRIANPFLTRAQQQGIANALDVNNSDVDLCEIEGRTVIYYSWGNQLGIEHLAEAWYDGPMDELLTGFFDGYDDPAEAQP